MAKRNTESAVSCGNALRKARERRGLTREFLADKATISTRHLAAIELGTRTASIDVMVKLIHAIGCSADEVFYADGESPNSKANEFLALFERCSPESKKVILDTMNLLPKV